MSTDKTERVMIDIETLGLEPGCSILSIGAVRFTTDGIGEEFYSHIDLVSCEDHGLSIDADTLEWWLDQDEAVKSALPKGEEDLHDALEDLSEFIGGSDEVWANPPSFDCEILKHAYESVGVELPWEFYEKRCYRTLKSVHGKGDIPYEGNKHNALDDARHQAKVTVDRLQEIQS